MMGNCHVRFFGGEDTVTYASLPDKQHSKRFTITAKALAVFLEGTEITESILMQRLKDGEVNDTDNCEPINEQNTLTLSDAFGYASQIANYLAWAESTVRQTIHRWNKHGLVGLWEAKGRGKKPS